MAGETHSLGQRPALANGDLVTLLNTESGGDVDGEVLVALLVTGVLGDEVEVLAADDDGTVHLGRHNGAGQDTAADRDETGEGALLVCGSLAVAQVARSPPKHNALPPMPLFWSSILLLMPCARLVAHVPM